jgi:hypothetical protein
VLRAGHSYERATPWHERRPESRASPERAGRVRRSIATGLGGSSGAAKRGLIRAVVTEALGQGHRPRSPDVARCHGLIRCSPPSGRLAATPGDARAGRRDRVDGVAPWSSVSLHRRSGRRSCGCRRGWLLRRRTG